MATVIGVDPGLVKTGWGVVKTDGFQLKFVACGVIKPNTKLALSERLFMLCDQLHEVIRIHQPSQAAIEETFVNVNGASTLKLGQARGALMLSLALAGLPVAEYAATEVKKSVTGVGRAEKGQVGMMVRTLLPHARGAMDNLGEDAMDALAIAICHANQQSSPISKLQTALMHS